MRLATFNILHGRSTADDVVDVDRFARAVADLDADVLALQEVDRNQRRSGRADLARVAAEAMGAVDVRFAPTLDRWGASGRSQYGVALLSRFPVLEWRTLPLPRRPWWRPLPRGAGGRRLRWGWDEPRTAVVAVVATPQGRLTVVATHLSFLDGWGEHQLERLARGLEGAPRPLVLLGDLNLRSETPAIVTGWSPLVVARSYPVAHPMLQIDHVLADGEVRPLAPGRAVDTGLSDHRALVVDVELDGPGGA
ncbi:endonuclease/exonuclease/phosphatase family protein [Oerskovia sp. Sa1BUA8]|uniref:Endonuclease/exonuclease/phosphatase family protein n=1 Tax=Oerskovia douganii TaxID=2762210 RepID=A0A9D5U8B7_9CELL|nr:endonuclease/exonuclease/phosphatase family protein [Oerskovia douganii]MBE7700383.1 endonuclease/exonuclease/phosphatase family protein [Oerskovia douganii]